MRYRAEHDGDRQWVLYKTVDARVKGDDGKFTDETREKEVVVGYFTKLSQVASRMYEVMVAEGIGEFSSDDFKHVIDECKRCAAAVVDCVDDIVASQNDEVNNG